MGDSPSQVLEGTVLQCWPTLGVGHNAVELLVTDGARAAVADRDVVVRVHHATLLADAGADAVDLEGDVDAIDDGLLVGVLGDEVLIEEAKGMHGRRGRGSRPAASTMDEGRGLSATRAKRSGHTARSRIASPEVWRFRVRSRVPVTASLPWPNTLSARSSERSP
jgi:hypothetical protein